jgi:RimJ/RimL family protein N-acetyltransferase
MRATATAGHPDDVGMIRAGRFTLRPWHPDDATAVRAAFAGPDMARQAPEPMDAAGAAERWLAARVDDFASGRGWSFAVVDGDGVPGGGVLGDGVLGNVAVTDVSRRHDTGWLSYWTVERARGRGVASAAAGAVAAWAFEERGLFRLELGHRVDNPASCVVARRAGFLVEGWSGRSSATATSVSTSRCTPGWRPIRRRPDTGPRRGLRRSCTCVPLYLRTCHVLREVTTARSAERGRRRAGRTRSRFGVGSAACSRRTR